MILAALNDYYAHLLDNPDAGISQPGYSLEKISYVIVLNREGDVVSVDKIQDTSGKKPVPKSLSVPQPEKRTVGIKSNFLWDKTSYVLGVSKSSKRSEREHAEFLTVHRKALAGSTDEGIKALLAFLANWTPVQFQVNPHFIAHGEEMLDTNVVFRLEGELRYLHESAAARGLRARLLEVDGDASTKICLVTGESAVSARLHPAIKGVNGSQSSGASIVSFNLDAFNSYGKSQGENAPVSEQTAFAYTTALNFLLRRDASNRQRLQIGDSTVVFWAQANDKGQAQAAEDLFAGFLDPKDDDAREAKKVGDALEQVRQGRPLSDLDPRLNEGTRIFVLGLSPNASRLSIRYWETGTLQAFAERLAAHYEDLRLEPSPWRTPPALWRLLLTSAPTRDGKSKSEDVSPQLAGELARAVLTGRAYPYSLLNTLIMRLRSDGDERIFGARAAIIKAILVRAQRLGHHNHYQGELPVSLDLSNPDPGYLLGRLFSTLENVQRAALGRQLNSTIRDRYYGAASATPASVFPVLIRNSQHHLSRLRKDSRGLGIKLEKEIGEIIDLMKPSFPKSLGIEAQGHFAIGYYHQSRAHFAKGVVPDDNNEAAILEGETV